MNTRGPNILAEGPIHWPVAEISFKDISIFSSGCNVVEVVVYCKLLVALYVSP